MSLCKKQIFLDYLVKYLLNIRNCPLQISHPGVNFSCVAIRVMLYIKHQRRRKWLLFCEEKTAGGRMSKLSRTQRNQIIREFSANNGGRFDAVAFVEHVRRRGPKHPAYEWFTWNDETAAEAHRIEQARAPMTWPRWQ
jgi:hypothetical protein